MRQIPLLELLLVRVGRIELPSSDWQPDVLPLNHTRLRYIFAYTPSVDKKYLRRWDFGGLLYVEVSSKHSAEF
jgi:hypothetical protein